jgi:hypothetical protein
MHDEPRVMKNETHARFLPCFNLINLWGAPDFSIGPRLQDTDLYSVLASVGYEAVQTPWPSASQQPGFSRFAVARITDRAQIAEVARSNREFGFLSTTVIVGTGLETDREVDRYCDALMDASVKYAHPLLLETHRGSITQDIRRTLSAIERFPELRFTADLSHWYVGNDLYGAHFDATLDALEPVFSRVRFVHGRIASPTCVQVSVDGADDRRAYVEDFRRLWTRCFALCLAHAGPHERIPFAPELLPAVAEAGGVQYAMYYAQTRRTEAGEEREDSDRWVQAGYLLAIARKAFEAALATA